MLQSNRYWWIFLFIPLMLSLPACATAGTYLLASVDDDSSYTPTELRSAVGSTYLYWPQLTYLNSGDVEARALFIFQGRTGEPPLLGSVSFVGNTRSFDFENEVRVTDVDVTAVWFSQMLGIYTQREVADDLEDYLEHRTIIVPNDPNLAQAGNSSSVYGNSSSVYGNSSLVYGNSSSVYVYSGEPVEPPLAYLTFGYVFSHSVVHHTYGGGHPGARWREHGSRYHHPRSSRNSWQNRNRRHNRDRGAASVRKEVPGHARHGSARRASATGTRQKSSRGPRAHQKRYDHPRSSRNSWQNRNRRHNRDRGAASERKEVPGHAQHGSARRASATGTRQKSSRGPRAREPARVRAPTTGARRATAKPSAPQVRHVKTATRKARPQPGRKSVKVAARQSRVEKSRQRKKSNPRKDEKQPWGKKPARLRSSETQLRSR